MGRKRSTTARSDSLVCFPTTSWTLIRQAQVVSGETRIAVLNELLRRYWKPLYAYYRSRGQSIHDAQDLVQGFLEKLITSNRLLQLHQPQKRFRDWLLVCARNYLFDEHRKNRAEKRRPVEGVVSFDQMRTLDGDPFEPACADQPEAAFLDAWRRDLLEKALRRVEAECRGRDRLGDYQVFLEYYAAEAAEGVSWKDIARRHELDGWKDAARRADWVKRQLARAIRDEVMRYAEDDVAVEEELSELLRSC